MPLAIVEKKVIGASLAELLAERLAYPKLRRLHPRVHPCVNDLV